MPKAIASGGWQSCAIADGPNDFKDRLFCWGSDNSDYPYYGQVCSFTNCCCTLQSAQPVPVSAAYYCINVQCNLMPYTDTTTSRSIRFW
jgi:hypothetical protein